MNIVTVLSNEFQIHPWQVEAVIKLLDEGSTIPFIARYRKEQHGELDDQKLRDIAERLGTLRNLEARRQEIVDALKKLDKWTEELQKEIDEAPTMTRLEDIYRPFRPKRKTRASIAREKGLEPLANIIMLQNSRAKSIEELSEDFIDPEKGVNDAQEAIQGAMDILAEIISDDAEIRARLKSLYDRESMIETKAAKEEDSVYRMYYDRKELWRLMPSHRALAVNRGEKEGFLKVRLTIDEAKAIGLIEQQYVRDRGSICSGLVREACSDAFNRLIASSLETELRGALTERSQKAAIQVFAMNLKPLLMQPPVRNSVAIGLDPGIAHGCKVAVVDATGRVLDTGVVYPLPHQKRVEQAKTVIRNMILKHHVTVAAIGNGTASRETEQFFVEVLHSLPEGTKVSYMIVNEAGASVYSASPAAAEEFPQYDVNIRSAISIARRLQDPLAELVKIDPQAIGVGQYQHDIKGTELDDALDHVVEDCVNAVGVDVNTASAALLSHVAGVHSGLAKNIVAYREANGPFTVRSELKKVPKLGPRAFEQCAGFLRIPGGKDLIENTGVHPESYKAAKALLKHFSMSAPDAVGTHLAELCAEEGYDSLAKLFEVGEPTLRDIVQEMSKPGRDPRDELPPPLLRSDVMTMEDLLPGMELKGTVRNVTDFGAFVDIGVHRDGLVHISQFGRMIRHPSQAVSVGDVITVYVSEVDVKKNRISLTLKKPTAPTETGRKM